MTKKYPPQLETLRRPLDQVEELSGVRRTLMVEPSAPCETPKEGCLYSRIQEETAALAHDINGLCAAVLTTLANGETEDVAQAVAEDRWLLVSFLRSIQAQNANLLALTTGQLEANKTVISINELILSMHAGHGKRFDCLLNHENPFILADQLQLMRLLQNLISNALKFTPENAPKPILTTSDQEGNLVLEMTDVGSGIGSITTVQDLITLSKLNNRPGSYGLGLKSCLQILAKHHGALTVSNNTGRPGATFKAVLPRIPTD